MPGTYFGPYGSQWDEAAEATGTNAGIHPLGHKLILPDAREYSYSKMGATVAVAGNLYQSVASVANYTDLVCDTARAIGATAVSATLGGTAVTIDQFTEGIVHINDATGQGYAYRIRRALAEGDANAAQTSTTGVCTVNLAPGESVQVALTVTTTQLGFTQNRFDEVIIHPSPPTAQLAGVTPGVTTANYYGWVQTKGPAAVLADGTLLEGNEVQASVTVDGSVENRKTRVVTGATTAADSTIGAKATDQDGSEVSVVLMGTTISTTYDISAGIAANAPKVGECIEADASTEYALIELMLA